MAQQYDRMVDSESDEDRQPFLEKPEFYTETNIYSSSPQCLKCGHVIAGFCMMALFQTYFLRVNFNVAMVAMLNVSDIVENESEATDHCPLPLTSNKTVLESLPGEFNWDAHTQGLLLGSFFYGYCVSVIPAGYLSTHHSAKLIMFFSLLISSIINLLTPAVAKLDQPGMLVALRVILGVAQGPAFPCVSALLSYWAAPLERTSWCAFVTSGMTLGTIIVQPLAGVLCTYGFDGGWPSVFYVTGIIGLIFCVFWLIFVYDTPNTHPRISPDEKLYLQKAIGLGKKEEKVKIPWCSIMTSRAVWAVLFTSICDNFGFFTLMTAVPVYLKEILRFDIEEDGAISSLPAISGYLGTLMTGFIVDAIRKTGNVDNTKIRKIFNTIGGIGPAVCMLGMAYVACDQVLAVVFLTLASFINCANTAGYIVGELEIAPMFYGLISSIDTALSSTPGFIGPYIVARITDGKPSKQGWQKVFYLMAAIYGLSSIVYLFIGTTEEQPWAKQHNLSIHDREVTEEEPGIQVNSDEETNS